MGARTGAAPRTPRSLRLAGAFLALLLTLSVSATGIAAAASPSEAPIAPPDVYLNVSATEAVAFAPTTLSVQPGQLVEIIVTQLADFNHTFLLSPVANFTFPASDSTADLLSFFTTHPPLVNLSLGETPGTKFFANFTAPPRGTYEFVCVVPTHFQSGMHGELYSGVSSSSGSPSTLTWLLVAVVGVIAIVVAVVLVRRRRPTPPRP